MSGSTRPAASASRGVATCKSSSGGVLVKCDPPTKEVIKYIAEMGELGAFIHDVLESDPSHLIVKSGCEEKLHDIVREFVDNPTKFLATRAKRTKAMQGSMA